MHSFHPQTMLDLIDKYQIDTINVVPSILSLLTRLPSSPTSSLRHVLCGSSPLGKQLSEEFLGKYPQVTQLIQGYGMTEVVVLSHIVRYGEDSPLGSCGKLLPEFEAKIVRNCGEEVRNPFEQGELYLRSEAVMKGYLNNEEDTDEAVRDGWMRTGDEVYFDDRGYYFVVDRVKDLIKVNGMQVSPSEIEAVILCHPLVVQCGVIGVRDQRRGQVPRAFVVLRNDTTQQVNVIQEICDMVKASLSSYKQLIGGVEIREELPQTASGKVLRRALRECQSTN